MALNQMQKDRLEKLKLEKEGVSAACRKKGEATDEAVLIISLGGLAGEALNILKGKAIKAFGDGENLKKIRFLAVDVDETDLMRIRKNPYGQSGGNMEEEEIIHAYNVSMSHVLIKGYEGVPEDVKTWLNKGCPRIILSDNGAQAKRQVGRLIALDEVFQASFEAMIERVVLGMHAERLRIILMAGLSGGTGGGMIVDITYHLRSILDMKCNLKDRYLIEAYVFTPDVMSSIPGVAGNVRVIAGHMKNGYAAFKEIEYYFNLNQNGGEYSVRLHNRERRSRSNLFDSCTVISGARGTDGYYAKGAVLESLTNHLLGQLSDSDVLIPSIIGTTQKFRMTDFLYGYERGFSPFWKGFQPSTNYPQAAGFRYNMIGYGTFNLAQNEILAYLAYKGYKEVFTKWKQAESLNADCGDNVLARLLGRHGENVVILAEQVIGRMEPKRALQIEYPEIVWPLSKDYRNGSDNVRHIAENVGMRLAEELFADGQFRTHLVETIKTEIAGQITICLEQNGPFAVARSINSKSKDAVDGQEGFYGLLESLHRVSDDLGRKIQELQMSAYDREFWEEEEPRLRNRVIGVLFGANKAIEDHVEEVCAKVEEYTVLFAYYQEIREAVREVSEFFTDEYHRVWEVWAELFESAFGNLKDNYEASVNQERLENCLEYFDSFLTEEGIALLEKRFLQGIKDKPMDPEQDGVFDMASFLQDAFDECFFGWIWGKGRSCLDTGDMTERILFEAFAPPAWSRDQRNDIWDSNFVQKNLVLSNAAKEIMDRLERSWESVGNVEERKGFRLSDFPSKGYVVVPKYADALYQAIWEEIKIRQANNPFYSRIEPCKAGVTGRIELVTVHAGLPLSVIANFERYDREYRYADPSVDWHLHLDANGWEMPNPYNIGEN